MAVCCLSSSRSKFNFKPFLVIVILLLAVSKIVSETETAVVGVPGETTTLQCRYTSSGTLNDVNWFKGTEQILQQYPDGDQFSYGPDKARLSGTLSESTKTTTLNIQQTQCPGDEGQYRCRVTFRGAQDEIISVQLMIKVEPSENPVLTTQQLNDQGSTKFMCSGQLGRPAKGITWYRTLNGQQQNRTSEAQSSDPVLNGDGCTYNGQSELRVDVSASDDGAQFTCMIGQKSASVSLTAASNPEITYTTTGALPIIDSAMGSVEFVKGSAVTLICSATGDPQPNFKWFFREGLSNTREARSGNRDNSSVLNLNNIQKPGYYECQASNILNQLNDPPSKVLRITLSEKSGNSITKKTDDCPTRPMTNITNRDQKGEDNSITHKNFSKPENSSITPITDTSNTDQNFTGQVVSAVIIILIVLIVLAFILKNKPWQLFKGADNIPLSLEVVDKD